MILSFPIGCLPANNEYNCCTTSAPCQLGKGDCDSSDDGTCAGSLVCGTDNCQDFDGSSDAAMDCCKEGSIIALFHTMTIC